MIFWLNLRKKKTSPCGLITHGNNNLFKIKILPRNYLYEVYYYEGPPLPTKKNNNKKFNPKPFDMPAKLLLLMSII